MTLRLHMFSNKFLFCRATFYKNYLSQYGRYYSAFNTVKKNEKKMSGKPGLQLKNRGNINIGKRLFSDDRKPEILMDFDVWLFPKLSNGLIDLYNLQSLRKIDNFSFSEFKNSTTKALEVVTTLISELRFSELEGLLTPFCKEEVEKNVNRIWDKNLVSVLAVKPDRTVFNTSCEYNISTDKNNEKKLFAAVRVILYAWIPYSKTFDKEGEMLASLTPSLLNYIQGKLHTLVVFNCKFIKEITEGVDDQWIINAINLKFLPFQKLIA